MTRWWHIGKIVGRPTTSQDGLGLWLSAKGGFAHPREHLPVPETFLPTITGAGRGGLGLLRLMVEARDAVKRPAMRERLPQ